MRTLDILTAWILIALGAVHIALTRTVNPNMGIQAIWFASGGLLIVAIGTLNLLRVAYRRVARGVYLVSLIANLVLVLLMLSFAALVPMRSNPQILFGLILAVLLTAFSVLRRGDNVQSRQVH
ncbi:MAG TPA: hypothetical protein VKQ11_07860 [Candidatus Sulfotelmatobacter sp.]|nr:hypothetical protein [Candidatus Sulfotelmatobacter sp.]